MTVHQEEKKIASLLPPEDARQVLLALFSEGDDLPEMTPLANMAYTAIKGKSDRIAKARTNQAKQPSVIEINAHNRSHEACEHDDEDNDAGLQERRFGEFWVAYPRKVGKEAARKAWRRIKPTSDHHLKILAAIKQARNNEQWQRDNGRYIPNPSTWLNQGRWDDEIQQNGTGQLNRRSGGRANYSQRVYDADDFEQFYTNEFGSGSDDPIKAKA